jgi:hypothetical protein
MTSLSVGPSTNSSISVLVMPSRSGAIGREAVERLAAEPGKLPRMAADLAL